MTTIRYCAISLPKRPGHQKPADVVLEDYTGYWLFEDGTRIAWAANVGTAFTVKIRSQELTVQDR